MWGDMKAKRINLHAQMEVFSKFIFINKSTNSIEFRYVKEHKSTDSTRGFINGEISKELKDREYE
jgi:hypothetical protein